MAPREGCNNETRRLRIAPAAAGDPLLLLMFTLMAEDHCSRSLNGHQVPSQRQSGTALRVAIAIHRPCDAPLLVRLLSIPRRPVSHREQAMRLWLPREDALGF